MTTHLVFMLVMTAHSMCQWNSFRCQKGLDKCYQHRSTHYLTTSRDIKLVCTGICGYRLKTVPTVGLEMHGDKPGDFRIEDHACRDGLRSWRQHSKIIRLAVQLVLCSRTKDMSRNNTSAQGKWPQIVVSFQILNIMKFYSIGRLADHSQHADVWPAVQSFAI